MTKWADNFDDNYLDPAKWEKVMGKYGVPSVSVDERNRRIEFTIEKNTGSGVAGIVSRDRYDLTKGYVSVYLVAPPVADVTLQISPQKTTTRSPRGLADYYCIHLDYRIDPKAHRCIVTRAKNGEAINLYFNIPYASPSNVLKIEIEAGFIRIYEGDECRAYEPYALDTYECYIYVYAIGAQYGAWSLFGTTWADDFDCEYAGTAEEKSEAEMLIRREETKQFLQKYWGLILALVIVAIVVIWASWQRWVVVR